MKKYLEIIDPSYINLAFRAAAFYGRSESVELLLSDPRVDPSLENNLAIRDASGKGHIEVVRLLLSDRRVNPSVRDDLAIRLASRNGHVEVVRLLLSDPRVDFNAIENQKIKRQLIEEERDKLRKELDYKKQTIGQASSQVIFEGKTKSKIPQPVLEKIVYQSKYEELCSTIPGKFSPIKLAALADLLKINYDQNTSYSELCGKIKLILLNF